ncbi:energy transducer TonB [Arcobacter sp. FWKO B]|uniref:energy transducer TonB n=1 Tax=Arcobacter sp. FWKO B TaxID=2593672 RepID=UPI0018A4ABEA|nr:TonB family protein [Arcobacter sp. FWKO B]QOG12788.1 energy transducer TonB [Arcobacter sp. FWKO B]
MATKRLTQKSYLVSFLIHSVVFFGYLWFINTKTDIHKASENVSFEISLSQFVEPSPPAPVVQEIIPPKPIEQPKPIKQEVVIPVKPIVKEKPIVPIEPVQEAVQEPAKEVAVEETKSIVMPQPALSNEQISQAFVQTNFTIIRDMVLKNLIYPNMAKRMGHTGVVEMTLVIDTNGKLLKYFISKSSDSKLLDKAAIDSVEKVAYVEFPKPEVQSTIILPVSFRLN